MLLKFLTDRQIEGLIDPAAALRLAHEAFTAWGQKRVQMPPKVYLTLPGGDFRAMPAFIAPAATKGAQSAGGGIASLRRAGVVGIKWISVYPNNLAKRLPAVNGTLLLSHPATGRLEAVLEANVLTALRTGAAGALATQFLARPDASKLLLVGSGVQSAYQLQAHLALKKWDAVRVWAPIRGQADRFVAQNRVSALSKDRAVRLEAATSLEAAVRASDVICTCTPSKKPLIQSAWVMPGTHINALGADAPGKQELDVRLLLRAKVVVDDWEQASHSGEINVACAARRFFKRDVNSDLGTALVHKKVVRVRPADITIFDSTGLAIQDMMMADFAVRASKRAK